jgi:hypothetical protein
MDRDTRRKILEEIAEQVLAKDSPLCWTIARELADFTVAFIVANDGQLSPAGTGTLVSFRDAHYFLTAAHVWEGKLKNCDWIRIPLKENNPCRFAISPKEIISFSAPIPAEWNEWGPDLTLLRIPPERVGSFTAVGRPFYPLSMKRERVLECVGELWFLMGAPALRGKFTPESAIPELQGMNVILSTGRFSSTALRIERRAQFDFLDIPIDTTQPDVAANFKGVSGGGLWRVYVFKGTDGEIQNFKILDGVAFWQDPVNSGLRVRCHGPQSIGTLLSHLYD